MTNLTTISQLRPGQKFIYSNVCDLARNECTFITQGKTPTGRTSYTYMFNGKVCKGRGSDKVIVK